MHDNAVLLTVASVAIAAAGGLWALARVVTGNTVAITELRNVLEPMIERQQLQGERLAALESWREAESAQDRRR